MLEKEQQELLRATQCFEKLISFSIWEKKSQKKLVTLQCFHPTVCKF